MNKKIKLIIKVLLMLVIMIVINSISNSVKADTIIITNKDNGKIEVERQPYGRPEEFDGIENEFLYNIIDKKNKYIRIEGYLLGKETENIIFPSEIKGYKVKEIGIDVLRDYWTDYDYFSAIKKITIGEGVEILGAGDYDMEERYGSFSRLANLKEVILPSTLKEIRHFTFSGCNSLEEIKLPIRLEYIGPEAFYETNLKKIKIGKNVSYIGDGAFFEGAFSGCYNLNSIKVDSENKKYYSKGGVLYNKNKTKLIQWPSTKATKSYKIPSTVKEIELRCI